MTSVNKYMYMPDPLNTDLPAFDFLEKDAPSCSGTNLANARRQTRSSSAAAPHDSFLTKRSMRWPTVAVSRFAVSRDLRRIGSVLLKTCFILLVCLWAFQASAQGTYTAASCSQSDVNAVINGPTHTAVNGDTIIIPATGSPCTWTSSITINGVGIDITGTGTPNTGGGTTGAGTSNTTLIDNIAGGESSLGLFLFTNLTTASSTAKIELLTLSAAGAGANSLASAMQFTGTCTNSGCPTIRVDNITFASGTWLSPTDNALAIVDNVFGVFDHNTSTEAGGNSGETPCLVDVNFSGWQGVGQWGDNSFASPDTFGTAQAVFLENNSLNGVRGVDSDEGTQSSFANTGGMRVVCRFNTVTNMSSTGLCSSHGTAWTGRPRGTRQAEVYYNTVGGLAGASADAMNGVLGGTGYYLSNTFNIGGGGGLNYFLSIDIARLDNRPTTPWGNCDGTEPWDQTPWSSTTQCIDQPGRGQGALLQGTNNTPVYFASAPGTQCTSAGQCFPNPALDPIYEAGEYITAGGGPNSPVNVQNDGSTVRLHANRDYYAEVSTSAQTSSTSPFNGTTGTGYGTLANRPTTCSPVVGYWATDQGTWNAYSSTQEGTLYTCTATNTWTATYTPYTYPHPLVQSSGGTGTAPAPPTSLTVAVD
jgi:hypothetical protein